MTSETAQSHGRPYCLDYAERPRPRKEPVEARKRAPAGEREHEAAVAALQRVHEHHEGKGAYAERGEQRPLSLTARLRRERDGSRSGERPRLWRRR